MAAALLPAAEAVVFVVVVAESVDAGTVAAFVELLR